MDKEFEWDEAKAELNARKHDAPFDQAVFAFFDPIRFIEDDPYEGEKRFRLVGMVEGRLWFVVFTYRGENIRLISARKANAKEKRKYYQSARFA